MCIHMPSGIHMHHHAPPYHTHAPPSCHTHTHALSCGSVQARPRRSRSRCYAGTVHRKYPDAPVLTPYIRLHPPPTHVHAHASTGFMVSQKYMGAVEPVLHNGRKYVTHTYTPHTHTPPVGKPKSACYLQVTQTMRFPHTYTHTTRPAWNRTDVWCRHLRAWDSMEAGAVSISE